MAKPELEDGFTQIANEILEKLARIPLAPNQWCILLYIIQKTSGSQGETYYLPSVQIGEATGLCKAVISRGLKRLSNMNLITRKGKYIRLGKIRSLSEYHQMYEKETIPLGLRWEVWERDNFTCQICGSRQYLTIDHIIPESKGGKTERDNLQTLCKPCNSKKGNRA